jgi:hypothetical protein
MFPCFNCVPAPAPQPPPLSPCAPTTLMPPHRGSSPAEALGGEAHWRGAWDWALAAPTVASYVDTKANLLRETRLFFAGTASSNSAARRKDDPTVLRERYLDRESWSGCANGPGWEVAECGCRLGEPAHGTHAGARSGLSGAPLRLRRRTPRARIPSSRDSELNRPRARQYSPRFSCMHVSPPARSHPPVAPHTPPQACTAPTPTPKLHPYSGVRAPDRRREQAVRV